MTDSTTNGAQDEEQPPEAVPFVVPHGVRQAQQRQKRAEAGVHLHSRRNPTRWPQETATEPAQE